MEFEVQEVVNYLGSKIGFLEVEMAMKTAKEIKMQEQIKALQEQNRILNEENRGLKELQNISQSEN